MCVIAVKQADLVLDEDILKAMWTVNDDGAGFMTIHNNELLISKGHMTFENFLEAYEPYKNNKAVLHFRIKTHGEINEANTHPFEIQLKNKLIAGLVHNGTFPTGNNVLYAMNIKDWDKSHSDTWHYNKYFFSQLPPFWWKKSIYLDLIKQYIHSNKLVIMDKSNTITIINHNAGSEFYDQKLWTSNTNWRSALPSSHKLGYISTSNYQISNKSNFKQPGFYVKRPIELTVSTEFTYKNETFIIPKGTKGWISKYFKYEEMSSFWEIRFYPASLPQDIKKYATLSFPINEKTLKAI